MSRTRTLLTLATAVLFAASCGKKEDKEGPTKAEPETVKEAAQAPVPTPPAPKPIAPEAPEADDDETEFVDEDEVKAEDIGDEDVGNDEETGEEIE